MNPSASDPIASKLLEADSELAQQEAQLSAQLVAIQQKRKSLLSVLQIFDLSQPPDATPVEAAPPPTLETPPAVSEAPTTPANGRRKATKAPKATKAASKPTRQSKSEKTAAKTITAPKNTAQPKKERATTKTATPAKGRGSWQSYVRKPYRNMSLPQAVLAVMEQRPNELIEVSAIMDQLFEDKTPKETRLEARDRLSNVLSVGLKNNKWYRGERGTYSVSKQAADASLS